MLGENAGFISIFLLLGALLAAGAGAQSGSATDGGPKLPEFEVATVKPSNMSATGVMGPYTYPGGRLHIGYMPLRALIQFAFDLQAFQIEGGPEWIGHDFYDVDAIPPETSKARELNTATPNAPLSAEQREMLQALLIERFGLKYHFETREGRVYWLVRSGKRLKMTAAKDTTIVPFMTVRTFHDGVGNGEVVGANTTTTYMAQRLSRFLRLMVVDKTGLAGSYDFDVPAPEAASADLTNAILEGLEVLGLKLKAEKGAIRIMVVDGAEKPGSN